MGGKYRPVSGPLPHPSPRISKSMLHKIAFWNAMGSSHHSPMSETPPIFGVNPQKNTQPAT
jgi:hypothetical protein